MNPSSGPHSPARQRGVVLLVVLVLLLIMTLLGLASLRGTLMEQRMSANTYDRNLSFQAAESGLREGEAVLDGNPASTSFVSACTNGLCSKPVAASGTKDRWLDSAFTGWNNGTNVSTAAGTPQYFIEIMGPAANWPGCDQEVPIHPNCLTPRYRVTARNALVADRAQVVLQSNYAAATP